MSTVAVSTFQQAIDVVESLPETQQEHLVEIIQRRFIESRRSELATSVREARADYRSGRVRQGTPADLLKELRACAG